MGYPYLHDASASKNVHVSNASRTTHPETHLETLVCVVLVLVAVRFAWWTMMAELCFSVDDFILDFTDVDVKSNLYRSVRYRY